MESMAVDVRIAEGVSSIQLHDLWLALFRRRSEMVKVSGALWRQWKAAEARVQPRELTGCGSSMRRFNPTTGFCRRGRICCTPRGCFPLRAASAP
jgi:hypothetical protein